MMSVFVVHKIEFGDVGVLFVDEHEGEGAQDVHRLDGFAQLVNAGLEQGLNVGVEVLARVVDPLFDHTTGDLVVVIVEDADFSAVLFDEDIQIGESRFAAVGATFFGSFPQCAFDLVQRLF